jgi:hypothetical protein
VFLANSGHRERKTKQCHFAVTNIKRLGFESIMNMKIVIAKVCKNIGENELSCEFSNTIKRK